MSITSEKLAADIHRVVDGDEPLSPQLAVLVLDAFGGTVTEGIEQEVLLLTASGYTRGEIAARLHLSAEAIESHVTSALRNLGG